MNGSPTNMGLIAALSGFATCDGGKEKGAPRGAPFSQT
jgi:hypothetical protein